MRFIRAYHDPVTGNFGIAEQDAPFRDAAQVMGTQGQPVEAYDLGVMPDFAPVCLEGSKECAHSMHLLQRMAVLKDKKSGATAFLVKPEHANSVPDIIDVPATFSKLKQHVEENGALSIPQEVRAWLTVALSEEHVHELGINEGVTWEETIACEQLRTDRDPERGCRVKHFQGRAAAETADNQRKQILAERHAEMVEATGQKEASRLTAKAEYAAEQERVGQEALQLLAAEKELVPAEVVLEKKGAPLPFIPPFAPVIEEQPEVSEQLYPLVIKPKNLNPPPISIGTENYRPPTPEEKHG